MNSFKGFYVKKNDDVKYDIEFSLVDSSQSIPEKHKILYSEVERTKSNIIKIFERDINSLEKYFHMLLSLAQAGLSGENSTPELSLIALENLKNDILIVEGQKFKTKYIQKLGLNAFFNFILCFIFLQLLIYFNINNYNKLPLIFSGAMIGSWLSFGIRKLEITFEDLVSFEKDLMPCQIRLIFIGIISVIFGMIIDSKLINLSIANTSIDILFLKNETTVLFGILCGILDKNLAINLYQKSHSILNISEKGKS